MKKSKILLVEPDQQYNQKLSNYLEEKGVQVKVAASSMEAVNKAKNYKPHLILLEIGLPDLDGVETCFQLRENPNLKSTLIVFHTDRKEEYSQIAAYKSGADDFMIKPVSPRLIYYKVQALLKRHPDFQRHPKDDYKIAGEFKIDRAKFELWKGEQKIILAKKEFEILSLLATEPGKVFSRGEIFQKVWGEKSTFTNQKIDVHICKLRAKTNSHLIRTIKGLGYKLETEN